MRPTLGPDPFRFWVHAGEGPPRCGSHRALCEVTQGAATLPAQLDLLLCLQKPCLAAPQSLHSRAPPEPLEASAFAAGGAGAWPLGSRVREKGNGRGSLLGDILRARQRSGPEPARSLRHQRIPPVRRIPTGRLAGRGAPVGPFAGRQPACHAADPGCSGTSRLQDCFCIAERCHGPRRLRRIWLHAIVRCSKYGTRSHCELAASGRSGPKSERVRQHPPPRCLLFREHGSGEPAAAIRSAPKPSRLGREQPAGTCGVLWSLVNLQAAASCWR